MDCLSLSNCSWGTVPRKDLIRCFKSWYFSLISWALSLLASYCTRWVCTSSRMVSMLLASRACSITPNYRAITSTSITI